MGQNKLCFILLCVAVVLGISACQPTGNIVIEQNSNDDFDDGEAFEMSQSSAEVSELLFIEPSSVQKERKEFIQKLRKIKRKQARQLYEQYIDVIGANGVLGSIEKLWPKCHSEAHDLGKVIFAKVNDIGIALRICADRCYSGCMHGVLMEAFTRVQNSSDPDGHIDVEVLKPVMNDLCSNNTEMVSSYSPGDCAHGVGHALMFLSGYTVPEAVEGCKQFDSPVMGYYCATGTYMEYVTENDKEDVLANKTLFYPCDTYDYPAACARYKNVYVANRFYKKNMTAEALIPECEKFDGKFRLGCFHGIGNAYMAMIASGKMNISDVCLHGSEDEKFMCIEGAIERMAKYHKPKALKACESLKDEYKDICLSAVEQGMYNMTKNLTLYLAE